MSRRTASGPATSWRPSSPAPRRTTWSRTGRCSRTDAPAPATRRRRAPARRPLVSCSACRPWVPPPKFRALYRDKAHEGGSAAAGGLLGLGQPFPAGGQVGSRLLDPLGVAGGLGLGQLLLGLGDGGTHRRHHRVLRRGPGTAGVGRAADLLLDGLQPVLEPAHGGARHVADGVVALLDPAELVLRVRRRRIELLRLGEQLLLLLLVGHLLGVAGLV